MSLCLTGNFPISFSLLQVYQAGKLILEIYNIHGEMHLDTEQSRTGVIMDDTAEGGLSIFSELFTVILCALKNFKRW